MGTYEFENKTPFPRKNGNPTLLSLLKLGAKIEFADGRYLRPLLKERNIQAGSLTGGEVGSYPLTREGLRVALADLIWMVEI